MKCSIEWEMGTTIHKRNHQNKKEMKIFEIDWHFAKLNHHGDTKCESKQYSVSLIRFDTPHFDAIHENRE